ncbi:hypothetical protein GH714_032140 [Hevea brasiliensis]|uniref:Uncharacterized protein n=1 Tax=Hevea brasiliensis TaxID=3981 RepID=A0A6A6KJW8_HEVBR|nr:hypothetical protein GH714_032140 [Hevea brasiliensis]
MQLQVYEGEDEVVAKEENFTSPKLKLFLHTLQRTQGVKTICVKGIAGTGSTHNFLRTKAIKKVGCDLEVYGILVQHLKPVLDRQMVKRRNMAATQVLVQWKGTSPTDATGEFVDDLQLHFSSFSLESRKLKAGSIDMNQKIKTRSSGFNVGKDKEEVIKTVCNEAIQEIKGEGGNGYV